MSSAVQEDQRFAELASNCMAVITQFNQRVEAAKERGGWAWSVERILQVITGALRLGTASTGLGACG